MTTPTSHPSIEQHPDLLELRARFERTASRPVVQGAEALAVLTGVYLAASPWIAGFFTNVGTISPNVTNLVVNNLITGIAYALLMAGFGSAFERTHGMAWAATLIGVWTIISPWAVTGNVAHTRTIASNCAAGGVATALGLIVIGLGAMERRRSGMGRRVAR